MLNTFSRRPMIVHYNNIKIQKKRRGGRKQSDEVAALKVASTAVKKNTRSGVIDG